MGIAFFTFLILFCCKWCATSRNEEEENSNMINNNNNDNNNNTSNNNNNMTNINNPLINNNEFAGSHGLTCKRITIVIFPNRWKFWDWHFVIISGMSSLIPISFRYHTDNSKSKLRTSLFTSFRKYEDGTTFLWGIFAHVKQKRLLQIISISIHIIHIHIHLIHKLL